MTLDPTKEVEFMKEVRWGMIGCGDVAEVKSAPGLYKVNNSSLVAVMNRTKQKAVDYAARHHVPKVYDDAESLINDPDIDAIYISTPPSSHKEYTLAAARAGKAIYVEKPMALDYEECLEMNAACETASVPIFVAYYRRALPKFLKIKSLIEEGSIGIVRYVNTTFTQSNLDIELNETNNWRIDPKITLYGLFSETGCHMLDLIQYYFGPIQSAKGFASNQASLYEVPDSVSAVFLFESGIHGVGTWNFSTHEQVDRTEIVGSKGKITYATYEDAPITLDMDGEVITIDTPNTEHAQQPLIQSIVDELTGIGKCQSTGTTAALTNYWIDHIMNDAKSF